MAPDGSISTSSRGDRSTIASQSGRTTARASRSPRIAATRSAATTTSGCSIHVRSGDLRQLTKDPAEDFMPSWSPDDKEIAFASTREDGQDVWAVNVPDGTERTIATGRSAASMRRPGDRAVRSVFYAAPTGVEAQLGIERRSRSPATRTSSRSAPHGPRRRRFTTCRTERFASAHRSAAAETIPFSATLQVTRPANVRTAARDFTSTVPRQALGIVRPAVSPTASRSHSRRSATSTSCRSAGNR